MLKSGLYTYLLIAMQQCCQRLPVRQCECILFAYSNLTCNPAGRPPICCNRMHGTKQHNSNARIQEMGGCLAWLILWRAGQAQGVWHRM